MEYLCFKTRNLKRQSLSLAAVVRTERKCSSAASAPILASLYSKLDSCVASLISLISLPGGGQESGNVVVSGSASNKQITHEHQVEVTVIDFLRGIRV